MSESNVYNQDIPYYDVFTWFDPDYYLTFSFNILKKYKKGQFYNPDGGQSDRDLRSACHSVTPPQAREGQGSSITTERGSVTTQHHKFLPLFISQLVEELCVFFPPSRRLNTHTHTCTNEHTKTIFLVSVQSRTRG